MSKKYCPFLYRNLLYKNGQEFLDTKYNKQLLIYDVHCNPYLFSQNRNCPRYQELRCYFFLSQNDFNLCHTFIVLVLDGKSYSRKEQFMSIYLFRAFDEIETNHKSDFISPKRLIFLHAFTPYSELIFNISKYHDYQILDSQDHTFIFTIYIYIYIYKM